MNNIELNQPSQTAMGALTLAVGTALIVGQPVWPTQETPRYSVRQTASSYSQITEQAMVAAKQPDHASFAHDMAAIYASLSDRQERLGDEFEKAIFDDLDSLYES